MMGFPYEIRLVDVGRMVIVPDGENTVSYAIWWDENGIYREGPRYPSCSNWGWIISSVAIVSRGDDREKQLAMVKESMESLPNLAHKFILVYRASERMFDNCYLVATNDKNWWREFKVLGDDDVTS